MPQPAWPHANLKRDRAIALTKGVNTAGGAVLTGAPENGSIHFHVDKSFGAEISGCAPTTFAVTPFGTNKIAAQWQEAGCQGGEILLWRQGK